MIAPFHFDRTVRVSITPANGRPGILVNPVALPAGGGFGPPQLRVMFEVERSIDTEPNSARVTVVNLGEQSRNNAAGVVRRRVDFSNEFAFIDGRLIEGAALGGGVVELVETSAGFGYMRLEAGYDGVASTIFEGGTTRLESRHEGTEWLTEVTAGDGETSLTTAVANKSFPDGTPALAIVAYLVRTMGLTPAGLATPPPELAAAVSSGAVCIGRARDCLDALLTGLRVTWWVDSGEFWAVGESGVLPVPPLPVVLALERPRTLEGGVVEVRLPLTPAARPGIPAALALPTLQGAYRVNRVTHRGDNRGGRYDTTLELVDLSPVAGF